MRDHPTLLKALLLKRHQQTHRAFCAEYEKAARGMDKALIGSSPSRETFARWLKGRLRTQPHTDHCRVLERMFPGHTVAELLAPYDPESTDSGVRNTRPELREAATNRRDVFHLGALTLTAGLLETAWRGPDLLEQILDTTTIAASRLLALESDADHFGERVVKAPMPDLLSQALLMLSGVRELLAQRQPAQIQLRLARVAAKLALVVGEIMFCSNQFPLARRWYGVAARAAGEAGDRHFPLWQAQVRHREKVPF
jgi:hypothetical protein